MKFIQPSYEILACPDGEEALRLLERAARVCYKSEDRIHPGRPADEHIGPAGWEKEPSSYKLIRHIIKSGHHSVLEHVSITVLFIANRGMTHELVRHRLASYSQESTRYCNYSKGKHGAGLNIIEPSYRPVADPNEDSSDAEWLALAKRAAWGQALRLIEQTYLRLIKQGEKPQEARDILPIGVAALRFAESVEVVAEEGGSLK
tara:strand:- start:2848 stop:3459 length:612 start_codon:yes stop_codon:yes gene_type:complete